MMRTFKYSVLLTTVLLMGMEIGHAVGQDEEAKLILRNNQIRRNFFLSRNTLWNEFHQISTLDNYQKRIKLREFAYKYKNLDLQREYTRSDITSDLFLRFVNPNLIRTDGISLEQKIRTELENDLNWLGMVTEFNVLPGRNFPVGDWKPYQNIQPTTEVQITYGGGLKYILDCFDEKEVGYQLSQGGRGIHVYPYCSQGDNPLAQVNAPHLAYMAMKRFLDFPVILTGTIQAKYLMPGGIKQEAAIGISDLKHIKNAKLTLITADAMKKVTRLEECGNYTREFYQLFPPSLIGRVNAFNARHKIAPQPTPVTPPSRPVPTATKKATVHRPVTKQQTPRKATIKAAPRQRVNKQMIAQTPTRKTTSPQRVVRQSVSGKTMRKATLNQRVTRKKAAWRR